MVFLDEFEKAGQISTPDFFTNCAKITAKLTGSSCSQESLDLLKSEEIKQKFESLKEFARRYKSGEYLLQLIVENYYEKNVLLRFINYWCKLYNIVLALKKRGYNVSLDFLNIKTLISPSYFTDASLPYSFMKNHFYMKEIIQSGTLSDNDYTLKTFDAIFLRTLTLTKEELSEYCKFELFRWHHQKNRASGIIKIVEGTIYSMKNIYDNYNLNYKEYRHTLLNKILSTVNEQLASKKNPINKEGDYFKILKKLNARFGCLSNFSSLKTFSFHV